VLPKKPPGSFVPATRDLSREEYLALYNPDSPQGSVFYDILASKGLSVARGLSLIIMNYMDAYTMDLERMEECSMFVTMPNGALIPFCSYQLTDCAGRRVYPPWCIEGAEGGVSWDDQHRLVDETPASMKQEPGDQPVVSRFTDDTPANQESDA